MKHIVVTGGPSAGKTALLNSLPKDKYILVPEVATIISNMNLDIGELTKTNQYQFQKQVVQLQMALEKTAHTLNQDELTIISDRGLLDVIAYFGQEKMRKLLNELNIEPASLLTRYDAALHMCSSALGRPEKYEDNGVRYESLEEAAKLDGATLSSALYNPKIHVIKSMDSFEEKIQKAMAAIEFLEEGEIEIERKWLMKDNVEISIPVNAIYQKIEQYYHEDTRVRKTEHKFCGHKIIKYTHTVKTGKGIKRKEYEKEISDFEWSEFPRDRKVVKNRFIFTINQNVYFLDQIKSPKGSIWILEQELVSEGDEIGKDLDNFKIKEVTEDENYKNINIAWEA